MRFRLAIFFILTLASCAQSGTKLCDNVYMKEGELKLNPNERVLVCGSQKGLEGWRDVPLPQAQYQIGVILNNKGYYQPRFERIKDQLFVWSGPQRQIQAFEVEGAPGVLDPHRKRKVIGEAMTPGKLNEIENWADLELRSQGYACPEVKLEAQVWSGKVIAHAKPGVKQRVASLRRIGLEAFDEGILRRYQAFDVGDEYDVRKTQLTVTRMLADGLVQSAYFTTKCRGDEVDLTLRGTVGEPRLLTFGIGGSTEELPFMDIRFKNTRLDANGSSLTSTIHVSPRLQSWNTTADLYDLRLSQRAFLGPRFLVKRESERAYEVLTAKTGVDLGRMWDWWDIRWRGRVGPTLNYVNTVSGVGPQDAYYLSWEGSIELMSHMYESGLRDQVEGWSGSYAYTGQREGLGSIWNVDRHEIDAKYLWNIWRYSPPYMVLATRAELIGVDADPVVLNSDRDVLPTEYRVFYGGDENLRGFGRQILNNRDLGYLTASYLGFELRLIEELPYRLQPFLLYDIAKLGNKIYRWDRPTFDSTGVGLRWASPLGTLRGSAARGRIHAGDDSVAQYPQEWVYFLSFGREF
jgi:hypothetical protein